MAGTPQPEGCGGRSRKLVTGALDALESLMPTPPLKVVPPLAEEEDKHILALGVARGLKAKAELQRYPEDDLIDHVLSPEVEYISVYVAHRCASALEEFAEYLFRRGWVHEGRLWRQFAARVFYRAQQRSLAG